jgi:hypothetical protein
MRRQTNVALRRQAVIDAAEALIDAQGTTEFAMDDLARLAGVSIQTIYNQFGSKSSVLFELLNRTVDTIDVARRGHNKGDPLDQVFYAVDDMIAIYVGRPDFYAALLRHLFGVVDHVNRPLFIKRGRYFWRQAVADLYRRWPDRPVTAHELAEDMLLLATGALETWIQNDFNDVQFAAAMRRGTALRLLALNIPETAERLSEVLADARSAFNLHAV